MANKDKISDWDSTPANNTDIGGVAITGASSVRLGNDAIQTVMAQTADLNASDTIASASTTDLGSKAAQYLQITGTTTITAFGTVKAGIIKIVEFAGTLTLTHNGTSLILPGAANITTAAGDTAVMVSEGSGNWRCLAYQRAAGVAMVPNDAASQASMESQGSTGFVRPSHVKYSPSAAKAWAVVSAAGSISNSNNITSVTKTSTGRWTVVIDTDLSSANYVVVGSTVSTNAAIFMCDVDSFTAGQFKCSVVNDANAYADPNFFMFAVYGDLP